VLIITGNPFALLGPANYEQLEYTLSENLAAALINEETGEEREYLRKAQKQKSHTVFPYPNPIKLLSRENQKEVKGEYFNAEMMNQGLALPISDIKPDHNIESEIFPPELVDGT
jgi:agmatine/peptidylarginine deiminase